MITNKIALAALSLLMLAAGAISAQDLTHVAATWQVQRYDLDVTPDAGNRVVTAKAVVTVKNISGKPASTLTLRISPLAEVSAVKINDSTADFSKNTETI